MSEYRLPNELLTFGINSLLQCVDDIVDVPTEKRILYDRVSQLIRWYLDCIENKCDFSYQEVARRGWASRHSIKLFKDEFSCKDCQYWLKKWSEKDKRLKELLVELYGN